MKRILTAVVVLSLLAAAGVSLYGQQVTADVVGKATLTVPADPKVAKLETDLAASQQKIAQLEKRIAALEANLAKVLDIQVIPADAAAVPLKSLLP